MNPTPKWAKPWSPPRRERRGKVRLLLLTALLLPIAGCALCQPRRAPRRADLAGRTAQTVRMEVTGYCHCGDCCGWKRTWLGRPVLAYGPNKGKPKAVGITASGTRVRPGTIAADTSLFPFGTVIYVPGYGYGVVEDRGGAIQGYRLDLYFRTHRQAMAWGRQHIDVTVWR